MRLIIAAAILCLSGTCALSYSAISTGEKLGGVFVYAYKTNFPTRQGAIEAANAACTALAGTLLRPCHAALVTENVCFSLVRNSNSTNIFTAEGFSEIEAVSNALALCRDQITSCQHDFVACERPPSWYDPVLAWSGHAIGVVRSWWTEYVTAFGFFVFAAFLLLAGGLAYAVFKLRQLQLILAQLNSPSTLNEEVRTNIIESLQETLQQPIPEFLVKERLDQGRVTPVEQPQLDTKAIKEALRNKRQEFEL